MDIAVTVGKLEKKQKRFSKINMSVILRTMVKIAAFITVSILVGIVLYILVMGVPNVTASLFEWTYTSENGSLMPALINTLVMIAMTLVMAVPVGIGAAVYMVEYAKKGNKIVDIVRLTTETLSGIPSIVYGLFGALCFGDFFGMGYSMLGGAITLAIMVLPSIMRTTEEALLAVPDSYREASFGLGAGKLRTVMKIVLPSAISGIIAGVILAVGRIVGETAALIFTAGTMAKIPDSVLGSGRTLAVHMYELFNEGLDMEKGYGTAVVLMAVVFALNGLSDFIGKRIKKDNK